MKIGISTASLFLKVLTEDSLETLRGMGADTTELFLSTFSEYEEDFVRAVAAESSGVDIHSIHVLSTQFEPQLFSAHKRVRSDAEYWLHKVCAAGCILGAKYYTFHGPLVLKKSPYNLNIGGFADRLNELTGIAAEYGITICYENIHYGFFSRPEFFRELAEKCPKIGACLDIKHAYFAGVDPSEYMDAAGGRLHTVHVVDITDAGNVVLPGRGSYDFAKLFADMKKRGIDAPVLIEAYAKNFEKLPELKTAYDYLVDKYNGGI